MANRYLTYGKQLSDLGYDVTPLKGKIPILKGWQQRPETAEDFTKHKSANIGLVTGGKYNVVAVDIDVKHQGAVNIIRTLTDDLLGSAPERIGNAPKTMFVFRCSEPFKKVKTAVYDIDGEDACVEVLAEGQQFVASGKHPDTKKNYSWPHDNLLEIAPTSLTEITPEDINNFIITCNTALNDYGKVKSHSLTSNNTSNSNSKYEFAENEQTTTADKLLAAMAYIPNEDLHYDDWTMVAHAIKGAIGAEGNDLFHRWSDRSDKYDSAETDRLWNSIGEVKTIGAGTLYHMASQYGFDVAEYGQDKHPGPETFKATEAELDEFADEALIPEEEDDGCYSAASVTGPKIDREWALDQWLPYKTVGMLFGAGGVGKSLLVQQLANKVAVGEKFMGIETRQMPVLCVMCEDDKQELDNRQLDINEWRGISEFDNAPPNCHLWPRVGKDNAIATFPNNGEGLAGAFFMELSNKIATLKDLHKSNDILVILDTAADMFLGNEVIRAQVNQFCKLFLGSLVIEHNATILMLAHPSVAGLASGTGLSGSTAWENSVRSRSYIYREADSDDIRTLTRKKSNYGSISTEDDITLIWDKGVLVIPTTPDQVDRISNRKLKDDILDEIECAWIDGNPYRARSGRKVYDGLQEVFKTHKPGVVSKAFKALENAGNVQLIKGKGYQVVKGQNKEQAYGI